jgi:hypothetical protein
VSALAKLGDEQAARAMLHAMPQIAESKDQRRELQQARQAFLRARKADQQVHFYESEATKLNTTTSPWADAVLLNLTENKNASPEARESARKTIDEGWRDSKRKVQILNAIALAEHRPSKDRVIESVDDSDRAVAEAAHKAVRALRLEREIKAAKEKKNEPLPGHA